MLWARRATVDPERRDRRQRDGGDGARLLPLDAHCAVRRRLAVPLLVTHRLKALAPLVFVNLLLSPLLD